MHPIRKLICDNKSRCHAGIYSCCSANKFVLEAAIERAKDTDTYLLVEATANQVNQYGGYTGMQPADFFRYVSNLAQQRLLPENKLIFGGDHLGPLTFSHLSEEEAMLNAQELVRSYVLAGFSKIHLDTSMKLSCDSPTDPLTDEIISSRGAVLCRACESAYEQLKKINPQAEELVYIIGSEVPIPGGAQEIEDTISVTTESAAISTINSYKNCFSKVGLVDVWERVIALVVQPGVEFSDSNIFAYNREKTCSLRCATKNHRNMTFEAHSTDYQTKYSLKEMVEDGFSILKVGPALTFALREALFALDIMEEEMGKLYGFSHTGFRNILNKAMHTDNGAWKNHYYGSRAEINFKLAYSFSDRARYYLPKTCVNVAIQRLIDNLSKHEIPHSLLRQYMPIQYAKIRDGVLDNTPRTLIKEGVKHCIDDYLYACGIL